MSDNIALSVTTDPNRKITSYNTIGWSVTTDNINDIEKIKFTIGKLNELKDSVEDREIPDAIKDMTDPELIYKMSLNQFEYLTELMVMKLNREMINLGLSEEDKAKIARVNYGNAQ